APLAKQAVRLGFYLRSAASGAGDCWAVVRGQHVKACSLAVGSGDDADARHLHADSGPPRVSPLQVAITGQRPQGEVGGIAVIAQVEHAGETDGVIVLLEPTPPL